MVKRPRSVTVVCWLLINLGVIGFVTSILFSNYPILSQMATDLMTGHFMPNFLEHYLLAYRDPIIAVACGIAMQRRRNWGRILIVSWFFFVFFTGFLTSLIMGIPALVLFGVLVFILSLPNANEYFYPWSFQNDLRKIISIISYILAGLILFAACEFTFAKVEQSNVKFVMIGAFMSIALVVSLVGLWLSTFRKWLYCTGIVLLLVAGGSMFRMIFRIVVLPAFDVYFPSRNLFTDYLTGIVCILVLSLAGGFFCG